MDKKAKLKVLDEGGALPDAEKDFWASMPETMRRDLAMLPTLLHEALAHIVEKDGGDVAPIMFQYLNVSASKAMLYSTHPAALAQVIQSDVQGVLKASKAGDAQQAALAVAYLVLQLVEEGRIPDAKEAQVVLTSVAIMEEAQADGNEWSMDMVRVPKGADNIRERLTNSGYLQLH